MAVTLPTVDELVETARGAIRTSLDPNGIGKVNLRRGSRNNMLVSVVVAVANRVVAYVADRVAARSLGSSSGEDLRQIGEEVFRRPIKQASAAEGYIRLTNSAPAATTIPQGSRFGIVAVAGQPNLTYEVSETVQVASSTSVTDVPVRCTQLGVIGNVGASSAINTIVDRLPLNTWSITTPSTGASPYTLGGGEAVESDAEYKARLRVSSPDENEQRGTFNAIMAGVLNVPGVKHANLVETDGLAILYAGDSAFTLTRQMSNAIATELAEWRCWGVPMALLQYDVVDVRVSATLCMARALVNYNQSVIVQDAQAAVARYFNELRTQPDEYFVNMIEAALARAHNDVQTVTVDSINGVAPEDERRPATYSGTMTRYKLTTVSITLAEPVTQ